MNRRGAWPHRGRWTAGVGRTQPKVPAPLRPWALVTACPDEAEGADAGRSSAWGFSCPGLRGQWVSGDLHYFLSVEHLRPARLPLPPRGAPPVWIFTLHRLRGPRVLGPGGGQLFWDIPPSLSHVGETAPEIRGRVWGGGSPSSLGKRRGWSGCPGGRCRAGPSPRPVQ